MPSWELFSQQTPEYQEKVQPKLIRSRVSIEAGTSFGWERWIGQEGVSISVDRYGASAPAETIFERYGFTVNNVVESAKNLHGTFAKLR